MNTAIANGWSAELNQLTLQVLRQYLSPPTGRVPSRCFMKNKDGRSGILALDTQSGNPRFLLRGFQRGAMASIEEYEYPRPEDLIAAGWVLD